MPVVSKNEAAERLASRVETASPATLSEIYAELFPEEPQVDEWSVEDLAKRIRDGLYAEELVDLWNVMFPADYNVWYNEADEKIHYNEEALGYAETD